MGVSIFYDICEEEPVYVTPPGRSAFHQFLLDHDLYRLLDISDVALLTRLARQHPGQIGETLTKIVGGVQRDGPILLEFAF